MLPYSIYWRSPLLLLPNIALIKSIISIKNIIFMFYPFEQDLHKNKIHTYTTARILLPAQFNEHSFLSISWLLLLGFLSISWLLLVFETQLQQLAAIVVRFAELLLALCKGMRSYNHEARKTMLNSKNNCNQLPPRMLVRQYKIASTCLRASSKRNYTITRLRACSGDNVQFFEKLKCQVDLLWADIFYSFSFAAPRGRFA